jgi:hypothetical protein
VIPRPQSPPVSRGSLFRPFLFLAPILSDAAEHEIHLRLEYLILVLCSVPSVGATSRSTRFSQAHQSILNYSDITALSMTHAQAKRNDVFSLAGRHAAGRAFVAWARRKTFHRSGRHKGIESTTSSSCTWRQELIFPGCDSGSVLACREKGGLAGPASSSHDLAGPAC